jgi:hypothetical protein
VTYAMDMLSGQAPDHQSMLAIIDRCAAKLRFTFRPPDGPAVTWQASRTGLIPRTAAR